MLSEKTSLRFALNLLEATTSSDVQGITSEGEGRRYFEQPTNWRPYGGREKNWDTVGNQQTNPVGAITELVTNGIDAVLLRQARLAGITDFRSAEAPGSMFEAVKRFFPHVIEGRIINLEAKQRIALAEQCVLIGVKRGERRNAQFPTYTIVDKGEGQRPDDFPSTFLSLGEKNKEGIRFVQGKFNMGSTGSLRFCTRSDILLGHYKLIVSRRFDYDSWGWTLVRVRRVRTGESLPVAEYFAPEGRIPQFRAERLSAFGHESIGMVSDGSIVRLYEYDIGPNARAVDLGLYNALTVSLLDSALPIQIYDFDAKPIRDKGPLRAQGIAARNFAGLNAVLRTPDEEIPADELNLEEDENSDSGDAEFVHLVLEEHHEELGKLRVIAIGVRKLKEFLEAQPARVFYTLNGQTHAFERASFLNIRAGLGDLRNHLLVNVVCDEMDKTSLAAIFMPDRERKASNSLSRALEEVVAGAIRTDDRLRAYAAEIRRRRATERVEDDERTKDFLNELVRLDPDIKELFGAGDLVVSETAHTGGVRPFVGKMFPTFLAPQNLRSEDGKLIKDLPLNGTRRIECRTDANDDYLTRIDSPGWTWCSRTPGEVPHSVRLRNGTVSYTVRAPKGVVAGDKVEVQFGFQDTGRNFDPLKFSVVLNIVPEEGPRSSNGGGKKTQTRKTDKAALAMPEFQWVPMATWGEHSFDEESGAYVQTGEAAVVFVNQDNRYLRALRVREKDEASRVLHDNMFRLGLGILTLSIYKKALDSKQFPDPELVTRVSSSAVAKHIVTVIRRLGAGL